MPDINGIAHIQLSVRDMTRSISFYRPLLVAMGMVPVIDDPHYFYCVGGRTALALSPADPALASEDFNQRRVGLHHICFRARSRDDVDALFAIAEGLGASVKRPPQDGEFAPGYYSCLFEDPDGIRLEINFVPGKGLLA